jgi:hypothetical protein
MLRGFTLGIMGLFPLDDGPIKNIIYEKWLMYNYLKDLNDEAGGWDEDEIRERSGYIPSDNIIAEKIRHQYFRNMYRRLSMEAQGNEAD